MASVLAGCTPGASAATHKVKVTATTAPAGRYQRLIVDKNTGGAAHGSIFYAPRYATAIRPRGTLVGPTIAGPHLHTVYFQNLPLNTRATDLRVQQYRGRPVLTYWRGLVGSHARVSGGGVDLILNQHYQVIRTVQSQVPGCPLDMHEFKLAKDARTGHDIAYIECYKQERVNATRVGGARNQMIYDGIAQGIDLVTNKLVFLFDSYKRVPLSDSYTRPTGSANNPWDWFHLNAVRPDTDGNIIISSRNTSTIYKVNRQTGAIIWRLGGKRSNFKMGQGTAFSWQHDPVPTGDNTYRVYDNAWNQIPGSRPQRARSHVLTIRLNQANHTAALRADWSYPGVLAGALGNSQALPNGDLLVNWGVQNRITEFDAHHKIVLDVHFPGHLYNTYRAYKYPWTGYGVGRPRLKISGRGRSRQGDVSWNGATTVARWVIRGGPSRKPGDLSRLGAISWQNFHTGFRLSSWPAYVRVVARDAHRRFLGMSVIQRAGSPKAAGSR